MLDESVLLSVVILTWKAVDLTAVTLDGLVRDGMSAWADVLVANDGSDNPMPTGLSECRPSLLKSSSRVVSAGVQEKTVTHGQLTSQGDEGGYRLGSRNHASYHEFHVGFPWASLL